MAKKISFSCWTNAENVERQDGHIFQAQSSSQSVLRFRVILPARVFSHANNPKNSLGALLLRVHRLPVSVKAIQIFICVINFSTRSIKRRRKVSKFFPVLTSPGSFINLWLTVPKSLRNGKQAIFRNRVILIVT